MKKSIVLLLLLSGLVLYCKTGPEPPEASLTLERKVPIVLKNEEKGPMEVSVETPVDTPAKAPVEAPVSVETIFDPNNITEEEFLATKTEITALISDLNNIIKTRNFTAWVLNLSSSYYAEISSRKFLNDRTEELYRRDQIVAQNTGRDPNMVEKRVLRTAMDYFNYVVVPSRANDRLDDISFISESHVRAYTVDERRGGQRLVLYELAHINDTWKIIN